jgi:hypothetical protein
MGDPVALLQVRTQILPTQTDTKCLWVSVFLRVTQYLTKQTDIFSERNTHTHQHHLSNSQKLGKIFFYKLSQQYALFEFQNRH